MKSLSRKETSSWRSCTILVWLLLKKYLHFTLHYSTDFLQCFHNSVPKVDVSTTFAFVCLQVSLNQPLILCKVLNVLWQALCWVKFRMLWKNGWIQKIVWSVSFSVMRCMWFVSWYWGWQLPDLQLTMQFHLADLEHTGLGALSGNFVQHMNRLFSKHGSHHILHTCFGCQEAKLTRSFHEHLFWLFYMGTLLCRLYGFRRFLGC